ncbi:PTS transporter subunit IIC [Enterococcus bulliens]
MEASATKKMTKKEIVKDHVYKVSAGISNAVLVTLGIGLLFETIGKFTGITEITQIGTLAKLLLAPAFGAGIAYQLGTNTLVVFSSMIASTVGANSVFFTQGTIESITITGHAVAQAAGGGIFTTGQPISAVLAGLIAALVGKWLTGKTPLDMILVPFGSLLVGGVSGVLLAYITTPLLLELSQMIASTVNYSPVFGSMAVALAWSILLMTPASSAALAIALQLDPVSSAAALIGCTCQFVGFTVMSFQENKIGANIAQGLITPKVQFANLTLHPQMVIPPFVAAIICAPIATVGFQFQTSFELAGLGLNSLIAPLNLWATDPRSFVIYLIVGILLPAIITYGLYFVMVRMGSAKRGYLKIEVQ